MTTTTSPDALTGPQAFDRVVEKMIEHAVDLDKVKADSLIQRASITRMAQAGAVLSDDNVRLTGERDAEIARWRAIEARCRNLEPKAALADGLAANLEAALASIEKLRAEALASQEPLRKFYETADRVRAALASRAAGKKLSPEGAASLGADLGAAMQAAFDYCDQIPF